MQGQDYNRDPFPFPQVVPANQSGIKRLPEPVATDQIANN